MYVRVRDEERTGETERETHTHTYLGHLEPATFESMIALDPRVIRVIRVIIRMNINIHERSGLLGLLGLLDAHFTR